MYCPKCAIQNIDNARFCRGCGTDLAAVSQALTGQSPEQRRGIYVDKHRRRKRDGVKEPKVDKAIQNFITGLTFILVDFGARYYAPAGNIWWFWMFIPAFSMIGSGIAEYVR